MGQYDINDVFPPGAHEDAGEMEDDVRNGAEACCCSCRLSDRRLTTDGDVWQM